jgi:hypothetical protein
MSLVVVDVLFLRCTMPAFGRHGATDFVHTVNSCAHGFLLG